MNAVAQHALAGAILASLLGGAVLCYLGWRYGVSVPPGATAGEAFGRLIVLRFGHAVTGVCFAISAILTTVALWAPPLSPPPPPAAMAADPVDLRAEIDALHTQVKTLETLLTDINARIEGMLTPRERAKAERAAAGPPSASPRPTPRRSSRWRRSSRRIRSACSAVRCARTWRRRSLAGWPRPRRRGAAARGRGPALGARRAERAPPLRRLQRLLGRTESLLCPPGGCDGGAFPARQRGAPRRDGRALPGKVSGSPPRARHDKEPRWARPCTSSRAEGALVGPAWLRGRVAAGARPHRAVGVPAPHRKGPHRGEARRGFRRAWVTPAHALACPGGSPTTFDGPPCGTWSAPAAAIGRDEAHGSQDGERVPALRDCQ